MIDNQSTKLQACMEKKAGLQAILLNIIGLPPTEITQHIGVIPSGTLLRDGRC